MIKLGVNIDHVATLRQARREMFPDPVQAALLAVKSGADGITAHLREDRRHIQDADIFGLKEKLAVPLNLEMAASAEIVEIAEKVRPEWTCLVPEHRAELTTEGGLDIKTNDRELKIVVARLHAAGIKVSLFVDPHPETIKRSKDVGADAVELHTGRYARFWPNDGALDNEKAMITHSAEEASKLGLVVNAGHGINYENISDLARLYSFNEFNIGFAIVAQAVTTGMAEAVREMKKRMTI